MNKRAIIEALHLIKTGDFEKFRSRILIKYGNAKNVFTEIYKNNIWGSKESISGPGSELKYTQTIIKEIPKILIKYHINTINDAPCGDFHYLKEIPLNGVSYKGFDIVQELIERNTQLYKKENVAFYWFNVITDVLPRADLILSRDMLIHFSFKDVKGTIDNFIKSGSKFLLTNTYPSIQKNIDIKTGAWRPINLSLEPYNFREPIHIIEEYGSDVHGTKQLALYHLNDLHK